VVSFLSIDSIKAAPSQTTAQKEQQNPRNSPQPRPTEVVNPGEKQIEPLISDDVTDNKQQPTVTLAEKIQIGISFFVAMIIFWQAWIYNQQRKTMEEQKELAAISERAYIALNDFNIRTKNEVLTVSAIAVNGGRTPAWQFQSKSQVYLGKTPIRFAWEDCPDVEETLFIAPGAQTNLDFVEFPEATEEVIQALESGEIKLFVDGECRYVDLRGKTRVFSFGCVFDYNYERPRAIQRYQDYN
jgi:hypothetical protein